LPFQFHYREYVRTLAAFELVTFRLPWATEEEDEECDDDANNGPTKTKKMNADGGGMEEALARREQKVCRLRQIDEV
jgi:hypothetical protein